MKKQMLKKRQTNSKPKANKTGNKVQENRKKLYEALLFIYNFYHFEDFLFLQSQHFLKLCDVDLVNWSIDHRELKQKLLQSSSQFKFSSPSEEPYPFKLSCPLNYKNNSYGELIFFSSHKFSQSKKSFLQKIAFFTASSLHFIENKEKLEQVKRQWGEAFDSFSQAFCITDRNFKIIRANQSFQKISHTNKIELSSKSLFELFPLPEKMPSPMDKEGSWLIQGERGGQSFFWEISFKPLFLKKEKTQALLFLIKDVTEEMEIEEKLSAQAKERELGLIKGSIAHELNNPIAGVKTLLSVVEKQISPRKTLIKDSLQEMQRATNRCQQIVRHLLFVSQNLGKSRSSTIDKS